MIVLKRFSILFSALLLLVVIVAPSVSALSPYQLSLYSSGIYYYDSVSALQCSTTDNTAITPGEIYMIGDSLTKRASGALQDNFAAPWDIFINAKEGRPVTEGQININTDALEVASAKAVVVALGTNNQGTASDVFTKFIEEIIGSIKSKTSAPIFWVDATTTTPSTHDYQPVNEAIHNNSVPLGYDVISWFQTVYPGEDPLESPAGLTDSKSYISGDGFHQTTSGTDPHVSGTQAFADAVFAEVSSAVTQSNSGTSAVGVGNSNTEIAFNFFRTAGLTAEQSAGIAGNFLAETKGTMSPSIVQGDPANGPYKTFDVTKERGFGLAQWTSLGRKERLADFAAASGRAIDDLQMQLEFTWYELTGEPRVAGVTGGAAERGAYLSLIETTSVEEATVSFHRRYERSSAAIDYGEITNPTTGDYETAFRHRIDFADDVYANYSGNPVGATFAAGAGCQEEIGGTRTINIIPGDTPHIPCEGDFLAEDDDANGYKDGELVKIRLCTLKMPDGSAGPKVNSQISGTVSAMINDGAKSGVNLDGGSFRSFEDQGKLWEKNCPSTATKASQCSPPTAKPGYSNHQMGLAIDMQDIPVSCPVAVSRDGHDNKYCTAPANPVWGWLENNAASYGLKQLYSETWHWSVNGG